MVFQGAQDGNFYRRFGTTYRGPVFKGPRGCLEMSVTNYHSTLRKIPKERRSHLHRAGNLKSCTVRMKHLGNTNFAEWY
jgi:hypothetical protein